MNYRIYTDGSTKRNGKDGNSGGYGFLVINDLGTIIDAYSETNIKDTTNNRMELTAILAALFMYEKRMRNKDQQAYITLYSDSEYALNSLFNWSIGWDRDGWKTTSGTVVKNQDLIKPFFDKQWKPYLNNMANGRANSWSRFEFRYIKGHGTDKYNNLADKLATGEITPEEIIEIKR